MTETSCSSPSRERGGLCAGTCRECPAPKDTGMPPQLRASSTCWQGHCCLECHILAEKSQIQPCLLRACMLDAWRRWPDARGKSYWGFARPGLCFLQEALHLLTSHMGLCRRKGKSQEPGKFPQGHSVTAQTPSGLSAGQPEPGPSAQQVRSCSAAFVFNTQTCPLAPHRRILT